MKILKNYETVLNEIIKMMIEHDKNHTGYQEDIYLYIDKENNGTVETFVNVGGNSWLDDDHITVYRMQECRTDWTDTFQNESEVANILEMSEEKLYENVATWWNAKYEDEMKPEEVTYKELREFINENEELLEKIEEAEKETFEEFENEYKVQAEEFLDLALEECSD